MGGRRARVNSAASIACSSKFLSGRLPRILEREQPPIPLLYEPNAPESTR
jgi:hypothetical protein